MNNSNCDIYDLLKKEGFIKSDIAMKVKKKMKLKEKKRKRLLKIESSDEDISDTEVMSEREVNLSKYNKLIKPVGILNHIFHLKNIYLEELKNYDYINYDNLHKIKIGGFIRYINDNEKLFWGGMIFKINKQSQKGDVTFLLRNTKYKYWEVKFQNFFIFYRNKKTKNDKMRELFMKYLT